MTCAAQGHRALLGAVPHRGALGVGQWGSALAYACALFDLELEVWQVGASYDSKPYRRLLMMSSARRCTAHHRG